MSTEQKSVEEKAAYFAEVRRNLPVIRPRKIQDLWDDKVQPNDFAFNHILSDMLFEWATDEEICEFLSNKEELTSIVFNLLQLLVTIGEHLEENPPTSNSCVLVHECEGCSLPCDTGFSSCSDHLLIKAGKNPMLHKAIMIITILSQLLSHPESDLLATMMTMEFPSNANSDQKRAAYVQNCHGQKVPIGFIATLVGVFDNCWCYPKLCHISAGLLSLLVARRPVSSFNFMGEDRLLPSLFKYLVRVLELVAENNRGLVEKHFGIVAFLNILPVLYMIGGWSRATKSNEFKRIVYSLAIIIQNICVPITSCKGGNPEYDKAIDSEEFPDIISAKILIEPLERRTWRKDLLLKHPKSFAAIAGLEVLGWYSTKGVDMDIKLQNTTLAQSIDEIRESFVELTEKLEQYRYIIPIMEAVINDEKAPVPDSKVSLLNGPLFDAGKRCGLETCRKNKHDVGQSLFQCSGGCGGLEYYCCKEHQTAHWKVHKQFCRSNLR